MDSYLDATRFWGMKIGIDPEIFTKRSLKMRHFTTRMCLLFLLLSLFANPQPVTAQASDLPQAGAGLAAITPAIFTTPGKVNTLLPLSDGSVLAGGQFVAIGTQAASHSLARLKSNGTLDTSFQADASLKVTEIYAAALQSDGKIIIAGMFNVLPDPFTYFLLRLTADGSIDDTFNASPITFNNKVLSVLVDGTKIVVGGNFTIPTSYVARLMSDGTVDATFNGLGSIPSSTVRDIARQSSGKYIIVGDFGVARLNSNGARDAAFVPDGFRPSTQVAVLSDDSVLVGGENVCADGDLFRWYTAEGAIKSVSGSDPNLLEAVTAFLPLPDGGFLIGGWYSYACFSTSPFEHQAQIWRYAADGSYRTMTSFGDASDVFAMALRSDGNVIAGGQGRPETAAEVGLFDGLALLDLSNEGLEKVTAFHPVVGDDAEIYDLSTYADGRLLVAGDFSHVNGVPSYGLARLFANGTLDPDFMPFADLPGGWSLAALALPDGRAVAGFADQWLYLIDSDGSLTDLSAFNNYDRVSVLAYQSDGKVLVGSNWGYGVRRLKADFSGADPGFTGGDAYGAVNDLAVVETQIYVAGDFSKYDNVDFPGLVRLNNDGSIDGSFIPPIFQDDVGNPGTLYQVVPLAGGGVLVGGYFYQVSSAVHPALVRLGSNGALDTTFVSPTDYRTVQSICVQSNDGSIWAGGKAEDYFLSPLVRHFDANGGIDSTFQSEYQAAHLNDGAVNSILCSASGLKWTAGRFSLIDDRSFFSLSKYFTFTDQLFLPSVTR
jgi:uncharacterized delta-60 repeat protein